MRTPKEIIEINQKLNSIKQLLLRCDPLEGKKLFEERRQEINSLQEKLYRLAFQYCGKKVQEKLGKNFTAIYWMAGYDVVPAIEMGGKWVYVSKNYFEDTLSDEDNEIYSKAAGADINNAIRQGHIKLFSYTIPEEQKKLILPEGLAIADACMIKTPGDNYPETRNGEIDQDWIDEKEEHDPHFDASNAIILRDNLWLLTHKLLKKDGILISTEEIHPIFRFNYEPIGKPLQLEQITRRGIGFCSVGNGDIPESINIYRKRR